MCSYEFPFNERIRTFLRLEDLFSKVLLHVESGGQHSHHSALISLLQMLDIIDRADLKMDLVGELDRQKLAMQSLRGNPVISESTLDGIINEIEVCAVALKIDVNKFGQHLRESDWLMSIKQRAGIPGGVCQFDLPSYHYWLNLDASVRQKDLERWLDRLMPMYKAIRTILHILRGSGSANKFIAKNGFYQQMLGGSKVAQMLYVEVPDECECFPEISANKYAINVRFFGLDFMQKAKQSERDIEFTMVLCNF